MRFARPLAARCPVCRAMMCFTMAASFYCPVCDRHIYAFEKPRYYHWPFRFPHKIKVEKGKRREELRYVYERCRNGNEMSSES